MATFFTSLGSFGMYTYKRLKKNNDRETVLIDEFNKKIHEDKRVEHQLIPIRDGLMVARKL